MASKAQKIELFLKNNNISNNDWDLAEIDWDVLELIRKDHESNLEDLILSAGSLANILQKCSQVHSVRWRIKDPEHLMVKIVRKRAEKNEKYQFINESNYAEKITDLVGIRALLLFKCEWKDVHDYITQKWKPLFEEPTAYIREGDDDVLTNSYKENGCIITPHSKGYRSIHYLISSSLASKKVISEIQVRTIFEEGWGEIDHKIRYPNFSDNKLISYFLTVFNRLAGNADEMGSFVKLLTEELSSIQSAKDNIQSLQVDIGSTLRPPNQNGGIGSILSSSNQNSEIVIRHGQLDSSNKLNLDLINTTLDKAKIDIEHFYNTLNNGPLTLNNGTLTFNLPTDIKITEQFPPKLDENV